MDVCPWFSKMWKWFNVLFFSTWVPATDIGCEYGFITRWLLIIIKKRLLRWLFGALDWWVFYALEDLPTEGGWVIHLSAKWGPYRRDGTGIVSEDGIVVNDHVGAKKEVDVLGTKVLV